MYAVVGVALLLTLGPGGAAATAAPLRAAVRAGSLSGLTPVVAVGGAVASLGSLLALILGVSRTTLAMARDRRLPSALAAVHPRYAVPHRAEVAVGAVVSVLVLGWDLRGAIGFSSFAVLVYYSVANASALTLPGRRFVTVIGLVGCVALAVSLPTASVVAGLAVVAAGAAFWPLTGGRRPSPPPF